MSSAGTISTMSGKYSEKFHKNMSVHLSRFRDIQIGYVVTVGK